MALPSIAQRVLRGWTLSQGETWCSATPPGHVPRRQGWKLHVSATAASAPRVLERALPVLAEHACAFKFAVTTRVLAELTAARGPRAQSGKFLTVYPADDEQLRELAEGLHRATLGLAGPVVLSDRRYQPGSLVSYRYGCFFAQPELNDEGFYEGRLRAPDGSTEPDQRNAWFSPPPWATPPFPAPVTARGGPVLLAGRYLVREAIRHANRGGVYRALDQSTGQDVLLKEARPHIGSGHGDSDVRDWLRHEAEVLARLGPRGITPEVHEVFEAAGHVFLAEDLIEGTSLNEWSAGPELPTVAALWQLARDLTRLLGEVHEAGYVVRDVKPSNVMMTPKDTPVLVDLECTVPLGGKAYVGGTPGFTAPEHLSAPEGKAPLGPEVDCFSLGATLLHAASGINPVLAQDSEPARPDADRLAAIVTAAAPDNPALHALAPLVLGLTAEVSARWSLPEAAAWLAAEPQVPAAEPGVALPASAVRRLLDDGLAHLARTADPAAEHLWPRPRSVPPSDPCSVQLGAGGVLAVLDRAVRTGAYPQAETTLRVAADWLDERLTRPGRVLPGLYFGRSGTAWALYEAARTLGDTALAARAAEYALRIPLDWHNPDVCHGLSGAGFAQLHLWRRTGDQRFAARAAECADRVLSLTGTAERGVDWPLGPEHRGELAGSALYGFGHGVAGNAAFLLGAGIALDRPDLVEVATAGGHALCAVAEPVGDAARWPKGPGRTERMGLNLWCNGGSGIGTFLIRLWRATDEPLFLAHAERAARAVHDDRWRLGASACHGVAGNAQLLLDLAEITGERRYRDWAAESATCLWVRAARRDGLLLVPDETLREVHASYQIGLAGVLDFLLRLSHGGGRSWLPDTDEPWGGGDEHGE
ncbi:hypothetical protein GCM10010174_50640 [Kutzneria viridogrisea]|uniref:Serine/threonine protein kinase n=1 Tax=Kutzneria viridogrisea TaxID=47990 RepID=A0ABR6B8E7_9PSEU|nr:serine/threonine protein kinase [Kutzneria viridogrisea]